MQPSVTTLTAMTETHTEVPSSYPPPAQFAEKANATADLYDRADADRLAFWAEQADKFVSWDAPWHTVSNCDFNTATIRWFEGARLNVAYNCLDRHALGARDRPGGRGRRPGRADPGHRPRAAAGPRALAGDRARRPLKI